jgi:hypothetical protein
MMPSPAATLRRRACTGRGDRYSRFISMSSRATTTTTTTGTPVRGLLVVFAA